MKKGQVSEFQRFKVSEYTTEESAEMAGINP